MGDKRFLVIDSCGDEKNTFGNIRVLGIEIESDTLDDYITEIALDWNNLVYGFSFEAALNKDNKVSMLNRFLPASFREKTIEEYVQSQTNASFYSFFAEYLSTLVLRDVFDYKLCASAISFGETVVDNHTGVDSCLYDESKGIMVLGESKFYKTISGGIGHIKSDLTSGDGINKLESFFQKSSSCDVSRKIILQRLDLNDYKELSLEEFLKLDLQFTGFVMHEDRKVITAEELKKLCGFVANDIENHISSLGFSIKNNYSLIVFNLPIKSKEELIIKVISKAKEIKGKL